MDQLQLPNNSDRFQMELEFVQLLANPAYLNCNFLFFHLIVLAQSRYFNQPEFTRFICYLQYWKQPEYFKYLLYPQCLAILDLLQDEGFRNELVKSEFCTFVHKQQFAYWLHKNNSNVEMKSE